MDISNLYPTSSSNVFDPLEEHRRRRHVRQLTAGSFGLKFMLIQFLAGGSFGEVYIARSTNAQAETVVAKFIKVQHFNSDEVEILKKVKGHANVVQFVGAMRNADYVQIVMTFEGRISYHDFLCENDELEERLLRSFFKQMVHAVTFVHSLHIAHMDIKSENFIVNDDMTIKLIDFGAAIDLLKTGRGPFPDLLVGSPLFMAPEMMRGRGFSRCYPKPADIWALGVTFFGSFFLDFPYGVSPDLRFIGYGSPFSKVTRACSDELKDLLQNMLNFDVKKRIKIKDVMKHNWFNGDIRHEDTNEEKDAREKVCESSQQVEQYELLSTPINEINSQSLQIRSTSEEKPTTTSKDKFRSFRVFININLQILTMITYLFLNERSSSSSQQIVLSRFYPITILRADLVNFVLSLLSSGIHLGNIILANRTRIQGTITTNRQTRSNKMQPVPNKRLTFNKTLSVFIVPLFSRRFLVLSVKVCEDFWIALIPLVNGQLGKKSEVICFCIKQQHYQMLLSIEEIINEDTSYFDNSYFRIPWKQKYQDFWNQKQSLKFTWKVKITKGKSKTNALRISAPKNSNPPKQLTYPINIVNLPAGIQSSMKNTLPMPSVKHSFNPTMQLSLLHLITRHGINTYKDKNIAVTEHEKMSTPKKTVSNHQPSMLVDAIQKNNITAKSQSGTTANLNTSNSLNCESQHHHRMTDEVEQNELKTNETLLKGVRYVIKGALALYHGCWPF